MASIKRRSGWSMLLAAGFTLLLGVAFAAPAAALPADSVQVINRQMDFFQTRQACLTVGNNDQGMLFAGEFVRVWDCASSDESSHAQAWVATRIGGTDTEPILTLSPAASPRLCLDVRGASRDNGAQLQVWTCTPPNGAQQFQIVRLPDSTVAYFLLRNVNSGKCLDKSGANVVQYDCWAPWWQQWLFGAYG
jgi:hypothetical protein